MLGVDHAPSSSSPAIKATYWPSWDSNFSCQSPLSLSAAVYFSPQFFLDKIYRSYPVDSMKKL
ncbi:hypothetical protein FRX31_028484 [Thalictrum thalictroides]|uniref:Uncharacterized protein n=1 Tax=Thalictrum thalictroides TaxID=46969 RepID=A0A7J6VA49_THATH|nr:hypothetical protein FRX31_028484 [Thalictrum thalictroides]